MFTTRPDTIFGVSFLVLAPEHELVHKITSLSQKNKVVSYQKEAQLKSERDRISDAKQVSGEFTGAFATHPFSGNKIPIWIGDYVLASYGTGAVMSVPCGDQRDWNFATHFDIDIPNVFENVDVSKSAYTDKDVNIVNSSFLNGFSIPKAIAVAILEIEKNKVGVKKIQYKLRDAVFSRQRYWGEPFPIYYKGETPYLYPGNNVGNSYDELLTVARERGLTCYHQMGTCRMGPKSDQTSVVNHQLKVYGIENLRIADASIMPTMLSANLNAGAMMIGEKASELIIKE